MNRSIPKELLIGIQKSGLQKHDHTAFVFDFSGVPATRSRTVFCSFLRYFQYGCLKNLTPRILSDHSFVILLSNEDSSLMEGLVEDVRSFLLSRRYGGLSVKIFNLNHEAYEFAICCVDHMQTLMRENAEEFLDFYLAPPKNVTQLGQLVEVERVVGQADISVHIRNQSIWTLRRETAPALLGEELWVSIPAMEEITGKDILSDDWMFVRFTELLDNRVLSHVTKEQFPGNFARFLNLNPVAVVSANFQRMIRTLPARQLRNLTIEVPLLMWRENPKVRKGIIGRFERHGVRLAFDRIPLNRLKDVKETELEVASFIKLHVFDAKAEDIAERLENCSSDVLKKIIFCRCETTEQIEAGVKAGVSHFQGFGVPAFLDNPFEIERVLGSFAS